MNSLKISKLIMTFLYLELGGPFGGLNLPLVLRISRQIFIPFFCFEFEFNSKERNKVLNKVKTYAVKLVVVHDVKLTRVKGILKDSVELLGGEVKDDVRSFLKATSCF